MNVQSIIAEEAENRDQFATIRVADATITADPSTDAVILEFMGSGERAFTPEVALSLAAALQANAVHVMEQRIEVAAA